jgi:membrane-associated phospholipid phosphatase
MTIHWFSDFVAGAIFGSLIGVVVGKKFLLNQNDLPFALPDQHKMPLA